MNSTRTYFLKTERLGISYWDKSDLAWAMQLWGDPAVSALIGGPFTQEGVRARLDREIESMAALKVQYWPVFILEDGDFAGCAGLRPYRDDTFELGFHFRPNYWGKGLAQEAAQAVIVFAFETLGVSSLYAGHHPANAASEKLIRKLGFCYSHHEFYAPTGFVEPNYLLVNPNLTQAQTRQQSL